MREIHIKEFCRESRQAEAAEILGCTQGAVSKMLKAERDIFFVVGDGCPTFYEIKRPKKSSA
jgi:hypothetical protein